MNNTQQYVCFVRDTGEIFSIGPAIEEGYEFISVEDDVVQPFKDLKENMSQWKVVYNKRIKDYELRKDIQETEAVFLFNEIPFVTDGFHDVELVIDKNKKECYIITNDLPSNIDHQIEFSITKKEDPHILYDSYTFNLQEDTKFIFNCNKEYSVYSKNKFVECVVREIE